MTPSKAVTHSLVRGVRIDDVRMPWDDEGVAFVRQSRVACTAKALRMRSRCKHPVDSNKKIYLFLSTLQTGEMLQWTVGYVF